MSPRASSLGGPGRPAFRLGFFIVVVFTNRSQRCPARGLRLKDKRLAPPPAPAPPRWPRRRETPLRRKNLSKGGLKKFRRLRRACRFADVCGARVRASKFRNRRSSPCSFDCLRFQLQSTQPEKVMPRASQLPKKQMKNRDGPGGVASPLSLGLAGWSTTRWQDQRWLAASRFRLRVGSPRKISD